MDGYAVNLVHEAVKVIHQHMFFFTISFFNVIIFEVKKPRYDSFSNWDKMVKMIKKSHQSNIFYSGLWFQKFYQTFD